MRAFRYHAVVMFFLTPSTLAYDRGHRRTSVAFGDGGWYS